MKKQLLFLVSVLAGAAYGNALAMAPISNQPAPHMQDQQAPPKELQDLLLKNAKAIEQLLTQVEKSDIQGAQATVKELRSIRQQLDAFMKQQNQSGQPAARTGTNRARRIQ